jgi:hypothetical protein
MIEYHNAIKKLLVKEADHTLQQGQPMACSRTNGYCY